MSFTSERAGRAAAPELSAALAAWTPASWAGQLHPADIGWQLRFEDDALDGTLLLRARRRRARGAWPSGCSTTRTCGWPSTPTRSHDSGLAVFLADLAEDVVADGEAYVDGALLAAGVACSRPAAGTSTPTPGWHLQRDLTGVATELPAGVAPVRRRSDVADRVAVQRAAFENSTFTAERWALMAASPAYDASARPARPRRGRHAGRGGHGMVGGARAAARMLEPVGTAAEHRGTRSRQPACWTASARRSRRRCEQRGGRDAGVQHEAVRAYTRAGFLRWA